MDAHAHPGLQIDEDIEFQRRSWRAQKFAFWILVVILGGAALGFFGPGLLSYREVQDTAGTLTAKYHQWLRFGSPATLHFEIHEGSTVEGKARVWIDRQYIEAVQIESVLPEPESVKSGAERYIYEFAIEDSQRSAGVLFHFVPREAGPLNGRAALGENQPVEIRQFVYP